MLARGKTSLYHGDLGLLRVAAGEQHATDEAKDAPGVLPHPVRSPRLRPRRKIPGRGLRDARVHLLCGKPEESRRRLLRCNTGGSANDAPWHRTTTAFRTGLPVP